MSTVLKRRNKQEFSMKCSLKNIFLVWEQCCKTDFAVKLRLDFGALFKCVCIIDPSCWNNPNAVLKICTDTISLGTSNNVTLLTPEDPFQMDGAVSNFYKKTLFTFECWKDENKSPWIAHVKKSVQESCRNAGTPKMLSFSECIWCFYL